MIIGKDDGFLHHTEKYTKYIKIYKFKKQHIQRETIK